MKIGPGWWWAGMLASALFAASIAAAQPAPAPSPAAREAWGYHRSDLQPHPGVRFGVLANGMRYAVMRNDRPAGGLAVRLHLEGGSSVEGPREQGFMHLLEHLVFHGSAHFKEGALPLALARRGLRRGADFNAFTEFAETVYRLDLAAADPAAREAALIAMAEIARHLRFDDRLVGRAKAAVRAELRERDTVQDRIYAAQSDFFAPGTPAAGRPLAGTGASVRTAGAASLRRLYRRYYVPGRTTLIMVGDFDPAAAEAEIAQRFADWQGADRAPPRPLPKPLPVRQRVEARLFVDPAAPTTVAVTAVEPLAQAADQARGRDSHFREHLASEMLNRRLSRIAATPNAPFTAASSAVYDHFGSVRIASLDLTPRDGDWRSALAAGAAELQRALEEGFSGAELEEQRVASRRALAAAAAPKTSGQLADAIADAVGRGIVFTAPGDPAAMEAYLLRISAEEVNSALRRAWASAGRLIFVTHARPIAGGEAAIAAAWHAAVEQGARR